MFPVSHPHRVFTAGILLLSAFCGCRQPSVVSPAAPAVVQAGNGRTTPAHVFTDVGVRSLPAYHQAEAACSRGQYSHAADVLAGLAADTRLSPQDRRFCREQQAICLRDAHLPVPSILDSFVLPIAADAPATTAPPAAHLLTPEQADCGPRALRLVCERLGAQITLPALRQTAGTTAQGTSMAGLANAAEKLGLKAEGMQVNREALGRVEMPALAWVNEDHYVAVLSTSGEGQSATAVVHDPNAHGEQTIPQERLLRMCSGYLLLVHR